MKKYLWLIPLLLFDVIGYFIFIKESHLAFLIFIIAAIMISVFTFSKITFDVYMEKNYNIFIKVKNGRVYINSNNGKIKYKSYLFNINEILKYQLVKNDIVLLSSGVGEALVGGVLFGGTGALAGAYIGKKEKYKKECILYIETNNIAYAGVTIPVTDESGFKLCRVFDIYMKK